MPKERPYRSDHREQRECPAAVLCDRDGTLIVDVPYNDNPALVRPLPTVRRSLDRLRAAGVAVGIVSNQSGVARGRLTEDDVARVMTRVDDLLGPFGVVVWCPHGPDGACTCRKPEPGLVRDAAARLGVDVARCAVVGDIGADVAAARAAGARGVLVPNVRTLPVEVTAAPEVATTFAEAVDLLLDPGRPEHPGSPGPSARRCSSPGSTTPAMFCSPVRR
jgi:D-glycero-D-manno-heptose 1,7-bisphosphate phosphatase